LDIGESIKLINKNKDKNVKTKIKNVFQKQQL